MDPSITFIYRKQLTAQSPTEALTKFGDRQVAGASLSFACPGGAWNNTAVCLSSGKWSTGSKGSGRPRGRAQGPVRGSGFAAPKCPPTSSSTKVEPGSCLTCFDLKKSGKSDGVHILHLWDAVTSTHLQTKAYCRNGHTVFLKRMDGSESFAQNMATYMAGFGKAEGEYWLGLNALHLLTTYCGPQHLRADLATCNGSTAFETYSRFQVGGAATENQLEHYKVSVGGASGTAGDGLNYEGHMDGLEFSTSDVIRDTSSGSNCKSILGGGGWWQSCRNSQPTGKYLPTCPVFVECREYAKCKDTYVEMMHGIYWHGWPGAGRSSSLSGLEMSLIPATAAETVAPGTCLTCYELKQRGMSDGVHTLHLCNAVTSTHLQTQAFCRNGHTVFLKREDGSESFERKWASYKAGFGRVEGEYWLGLDALHLLTTNCGPQHLRADLSSCDGSTAFEKYSRFQIGDESTFYLASVGEAAGTARDGLNNGHDGVPSQKKVDGMAFTTTDSDHDTIRGYNCASDYGGGGGWWYNNCYYAQPTGQYQPSCPVFNGTFKGIYWLGWPGAQLWPEALSSLSALEMSVISATAP